ncbi:hypothetical protein G7048_26265 (plasmid) [Diaphorobacter sp. HDW4B]|uniref:hypothetical protein n=1 Tax=Diaphorobacter sp. HDW4B TaxID=2714925 RepID=UPI00140BD826|nr:hypothetical protein [Diaphorobacter sp. HDW4B]QIL73997.1 hypothetical protein G7048_26265 [Diaphorobacter sp. HDW4B]
MAVSTSDDYFHKRPDHPYWNESGWFSFMQEERDLSGWIYFYHRPSIGYTVGGICAWDNTGSENYDCLCYDWGEPYPMKPDTNMFDFEIDNGLKVNIIEPLKSYKFGYHGANAYTAGGCELDLTFTAPMLPHDAGMPGGLDEWGKGHYDQSGRMKGTLQLGKERIEIDCVSQRDHSWGVRKLNGNPRGQMIWAIGEKSSFHALAVSRLPMDKDPVIGTAEDVIIGYYLKDGLYGDITLGSGTIKVVERDPTGRPVRYLLECTDSLGRKLEAEGRIKNMLNWQGYSWLMTYWSLVEWTFDGQTAYGEGQDYWPLQQSRRFMQSLR